jgi:hypothetical protein
MTADSEIHPLSPARPADFMGFFDGHAFSGNPKWSSCHCQCFFEDHSKVHWASRTAAPERDRDSRESPRPAGHVPRRRVRCAPNRR